MDRILTAKSQRGYDPAPMVVGFTGTKRYKRDTSFQAVKALGGIFVSKDDQPMYLAAIAKALGDLKQQRKGPHIQFIHSGCHHPENASLLPRKRVECSDNGHLVRVQVIPESDASPVEVATNFRSLLLLDLLASRNKSMTAEDIARSLHAIPFYRGQMKNDLPYAPPYKAVLMNLNRARTALRNVLHHPFNIEDVLHTKYFDSVNGESIDDPQMIARLHDRARGLPKPLGDSVRVPRCVASYTLCSRHSVSHI